ncbi:hypothetical protein QJS04_geneDACA021417 [Acorus gramineus]|uniref:Uncharacterized protein n=1 Tax=Acorus gramineus TaxID=55184 RepID=A0AAV9A728_ACOGR|nr:hypothetical protein QJS04_geneDACA021417 [Acorus gramineus]
MLANITKTFSYDEAGCVMKPTVEVPNTDEGRKTLATTTTSKGKEKFVPQWIEVSRSITNPKGKQYVDVIDPISTSQPNSMVSPPSANKFTIVQDIPEEDEPLIEATEEKSTPVNIKNNVKHPASSVQPNEASISSTIEGNSAPQTNPIPSTIPPQANHFPSTISPPTNTIPPTLPLTATVIGPSQRILTRSQSSGEPSQTQSMHFVTHENFQSTANNVNQNEIFPPSYLFESPTLLSEVVNLPLVDIPLEIDRFLTSLETPLISHTARVKQGSGRIHKSKHKGGGPPQPPKKNKTISKGAPSGKKSTRSYME